jgi:hypothetical protein
MALAAEWRRWRGVFAAVLLLLFTVAPSLDGIVCGDDGAVAAESHVLHGDHDATDDAAEDDAHGACHHGHCHHGSGFAPPQGVTAPSIYGERARSRMEEAAGAVLDRQFGLMRPPRP